MTTWLLSISVCIVHFMWTPFVCSFVVAGVVFDVRTKWPQNHGEVVRLLLWYAANGDSPKSNQHWHAFYSNSTVANEQCKCIQYHPDNELTYSTGQDMSLFIWFLFCRDRNKEINRFLALDLACALLLAAAAVHIHRIDVIDSVSLEQAKERRIEHFTTIALFGLVLYNVCACLVFLSLILCIFFCIWWMAHFTCGMCIHT